MIFTTNPQGEPDEVVSAGPPLECQWYLYYEIREFCDMTKREVMCPLPLKKIGRV